MRSIIFFLLASFVTFGCVLPPEDVADDNTIVVEPTSPTEPVSPEEPTSPTEQEFYFCPTSPSGISSGCCTTTSFDSASGPVPGMLIKSDASPMVYYFGSNGKRYVFPNSDTLVSWYEPYHSDTLLSGESDVCAMVVEFPSATVNTLLVGGNVTFRPGSYITGIVSDPARYVVGNGGQLRRLATPSMAEDIYPNEVAERTRILSEAFFINYTLGEDVAEASDFEPAVEFVQAYIEDELGITKAPVCNPSVGSLSISLNSLPTTTLANGDTTLLRFTVTAGVDSDIEIKKLSFRVVTDFSSSGVLVQPRIQQLGVAETTSWNVYFHQEGSGIWRVTAAFSDEVIPAGTSRTYDLKAVAGNVFSSDGVSARLLTDMTGSTGALTGDVQDLGLNNVSQAIIWSSNSCGWKNGSYGTVATDTTVLLVP